MRWVVCHCGATAEIPCADQAPSLGEIRAAGWGFAWDVSNGLTRRWLCGTCSRRVADLAAEIEAIVGSDTLSFTQLLTADGRARRGQGSPTSR